MADDRRLIFEGTVVDSSLGQDLRICEQQIVGVEGSKIIFRDSVEKLAELTHQYDINKDEIRKLPFGMFLMPGFVDAHLHAPQYRFQGNHMDLNLLQWLEQYTMPTEARFSDLTLARDVFDKVVKRTLKNGTTTALYFSTIHLPASLLLCELTSQHGQRAYVGKVNMDDNSPDYYVETTEESMRDTEEFIQTVLNKQDPLLCPVITPRFPPSCTPQLLTFLGETARKYDIPIQLKPVLRTFIVTQFILAAKEVPGVAAPMMIRMASHISECQSECQYVLGLFPQCKSYAEAFDVYKLLTDKTVLAHGVHLTDEEVELLKARGTGIAHCPNSNISIRSGLCDVRRLLKNHNKVGLGTDIAAGYSYSILDAIRYTILTSKVLSTRTSNYQPLSHQEAFRLATLGGCEVLGISDKLGTIEVGKQFDALIINVNKVDGPIDTFQGDNNDGIIEKFLLQGDDRNIEEVYVAGQRISI